MYRTSAALGLKGLVAENALSLAHRSVEDRIETQEWFRKRRSILLPAYFVSDPGILDSILEIFKQPFTAYDLKFLLLVTQVLLKFEKHPCCSRDKIHHRPYRRIIDGCDSSGPIHRACSHSDDSDATEEDLSLKPQKLEAFLKIGLALEQDIMDRISESMRSRTVKIAYHVLSNIGGDEPRDLINKVLEFITATFSSLSKRAKVVAVRLINDYTLRPVPSTDGRPLTEFESRWKLLSAELKNIEFSLETTDLEMQCELMISFNVIGVTYPLDYGPFLIKVLMQQGVFRVQDGSYQMRLLFHAIRLARSALRACLPNLRMHQPQGDFKLLRDAILIDAVLNLSLQSQLTPSKDLSSYMKQTAAELYTGLLDIGGEYYAPKMMDHGLVAALPNCGSFVGRRQLNDGLTEFPLSILRNCMSRCRPVAERENRSTWRISDLNQEHFRLEDLNKDRADFFSAVNERYQRPQSPPRQPVFAVLSEDVTDF